MTSSVEPYQDHPEKPVMFMRFTLHFLAFALLALSGLATGCGQTSAPKQEALTPQQDALTPDQAAALDRIGQLSVAGRVTPSVIIAVARNGQMVYAKGFGYRHVESSAQTTPATRYPIGSNTKQFTAAAILLLQDDGKLSIEDPLSKYLPQIPHAGEVTLRQLLAMTHGYPDYLALEEFPKLSARPVTPEKVVALVVDRPLEFKPGAKWDYSNTGYVLLQMVIEKLSGMLYQDFLQQRIFGPLGMTSTYVRGSEDKTADVAKEYTSFALGPWEDSPAWNYTWFGAAGAMISTPADLLKWNAGLDGGKLLSSRSLQQMQTPMNLKPNPDYGLGIIVTKLSNGHRMIYHGGNTAGSSSQNARFPDDHLAIIVMANSKTLEYNDVVKAIYSVLVPSSPETPTNEVEEAPASAAPADSAQAREAKAWLEDAINGRIDETKVRSDFREQLTPEHRAALRELGKFGPRTYELSGVDYRTGTTFFVYNVTAGSKQIIYSFARDDKLGIATPYTSIVERLIFPTASSGTAPAPGATLPREAVVALDVVKQHFPDITKEAETGSNATMVGKPIATRAVVFTNDNGSKKVTLSVDQYATPQDATSAFQQAVEGSKTAPGFKLAASPSLGQQAFAGTSQVGAEMHFGLGARDGTLIVAATFAGLPVTPNNSNQLITLGGAELKTARKALGPSGSR